jgi:hypothetical protein
MSRRPVPHKAICDAVFKPELLPAVYRWVANLSPQEFVRFATVFPPLARESSASASPRALPVRLQASRYTMPELGFSGPA